MHGQQFYWYVHRQNPQNQLFYYNINQGTVKPHQKLEYITSIQ